MKQTPDHQHTTNNAFGHACTRLRHQMQLTQQELARHLSLSTRTIQQWERGLSFPSRAHLIQLLALALQRQAFPHGTEYQEAQQLWLSAHQQTNFDTFWMQIQLSAPPAPRTLMVLKHKTPSTDAPQAQETSPSTRFDWGEALDVRHFYGRSTQLCQLEHWVLQEHSRLVCLLGMGGIGKSALAVTFMHQAAPSFQSVIFRSIRNAPPCQDLLASCLQVLSPQTMPSLLNTVQQRIALLLQCFQTQRCLLILDNLESLLQENDPAGNYRPGYEDYALLLRMVAQTEHQSCLLLTGREPPAELSQWEIHQDGVRVLHLIGLESEACEHFFSDHLLLGNSDERQRLTQLYAGNPLALKIIIEVISELFGGEIAPFLEQNATIFSSIRDLLAEQFARLSTTEQTLLIWLSIAREPLSLSDLHALLVPPISETLLAEAMLALQRRSLVEQGKQHSTFTLQSVVLEFVTEHLIEQVSEQILQGHLTSLTCYALQQARCKEYVRQAQERLIVAPILTSLQTLSQQTHVLEKQLLHLLDILRAWPYEAQGYAPANLANLLRLLRGDLRNCNLSGLSLRGISLQGIQMQGATLAGALIQDCAFTETLDATWAVAISKSGQYWAAGNRRGEIRVWKEGGQTLHLVWQAHTDTTYALAFSPDERTLASGGWDRTVKLWNLVTGTLLWTGLHTDSSVGGLAFAPDGHILASGGDDAMIRLWETTSGTPILAQAVPKGAVYSLLWSPDGKLLAHSCKNGSIHLWQVQTPLAIGHIQILTGHTEWVLGLAFSPDGTRLASGSWDGTVKLWDIPSEQMCQLPTEYVGMLRAVAWSPDGHTIAYSDYHGLIWLWDVEQNRSRMVLQGHTSTVNGLAFTPDSQSLLSSGEDGILRLWHVASGACLRIVEGYAVTFYDIAWNPTSSQLASADTSAQVILWDVFGQRPPRILHQHRWVIYGVDWSPNGQLLASSGWDNALCLWNPDTGHCLQVLRDPDSENPFFHGIAWSPDNSRLAIGTYMNGVQVWDTRTGKRCWIAHPLPTKIRRVAWHPDGSLLASSGDDGSVCLWNTSNGSLLQRLLGHQGMVANIAWSPDGSLLASCGGGQGGRELLVWDVQHGECIQAFSGPAGILWAVAWNPSANFLVSGDSDGVLRWWKRESGTCMRVREAHQGAVQAIKVSPDGQTLASCGDDGAIRLWNLQTGEHLRTLRHDRPYERLDITGIKGLTEAQKAKLQTLGAIDHYLELPYLGEKASHNHFETDIPFLM